MPKSHPSQYIWAIEGRFQHLIFSPKGAIEGVLIDTDGTPTQFVLDGHDEAAGEQFTGLKTGQAVVLEGSEEPPSPKGEAQHFVYRFTRLASVDGKPAGMPAQASEVSGKVARLNYARHGVPNGFVLDTGDFVHTKPGGFAGLGLQVGDKVRAQGPARPLVTGRGKVVEAQSVNGLAVGPAA